MNITQMRLQEIVSENIRGFRQLQGLTQEALAAKARMSANFLSSFERGKSGLGLGSVEKIARVLKVEPSTLLIKDAFRQ